MRTKKLLLLGLLAVTLVLTGALVIKTQGVASAGMYSQEKAVSVNGLNTEALGGLIDMLKRDSKAGRITFFSNSKWQDGMRSLTSFTGYKIDGKMNHEKERQFVLLGDEGVELSEKDLTVKDFQQNRSVHNSKATPFLLV